MRNKRYTPVLSPHAKRDLDRFSGKILQQLKNAIAAVVKEPRGSGTKKLAVSDQNLYRKKSGNYRILYEIDDVKHEVIVHRIGDRKDIYRG
ncbi:MAG TPA: type II toxin-antitoxin system RelE/ParE family toxin [Pirellulaceae bacterium]|jgi:mRNA interferase RelE/StbE